MTTQTSEPGGTDVRPRKKKRLTLSDHLALRAQAQQEAEAREQERLQRMRALKALDEAALCMCPACVRARQLRKDKAPRS